MSIKKQTILLHISMQFYKKSDLDNALKNVLKAIELNPDSKQLKDFKNVTFNWNEHLNIFGLVLKVWLPLYSSSTQRRECPADMESVLERLKELCQKQRNDPSTPLKNTHM